MTQRWFTPIRDLYNSFKTGPEGFAARKLTGFACLATALYMCLFTVPEADRLYAVCALLLCALFCFGLVTWEQINQLQGGGMKNIFKQTTEFKTETNETNNSTAGPGAV